jgi:hypothetical protein
MPVERDPATKPRTRSPVGDPIFVAHRDLDAILAEARESFGDRGAVAGTLERLAEAFDVHFEQEDRLYYPTIGSLRPELRGRLCTISAGHESFRVRLGEVRALLDDGELQAARESFDSLASDFEAHEGVEEELLVALERELIA